MLTVDSVAAERALVAPLRFHGTPGQVAPVGMTKFKSVSDLWIGYLDGGFKSGCSREGTAGPSLPLRSVGMTKWRWLADLGVGYLDGGF